MRSKCLDGIAFTQLRDFATEEGDQDELRCPVCCEEIADHAEEGEVD